MSETKLNKRFDITVSAEYQSYRFGSSIEMNVPDDISSDNAALSEFASQLSKFVVEETISDVRAFAAHNDKFAAVLNKRNLKLDSLPHNMDELSDIPV